jgi:hypothetical protein
MYYVQAKHNDNLALTLSSTLATQLSKNQTLNAGVILGTNKGKHYQTMEDLLGASSFHNINTYALGTYDMSSDAVQYDLNTAGPTALVNLFMKVTNSVTTTIF